jgi:hypothetical protein
VRKDGTKVKTKDVDPNYKVMCHILSERNDAQNMVNLYIPMAPMSHYIREKKKEGVTVSHLALIIAAYLRTAAEFKKLNYFVVNKNLYCHNDFTCGMVVLKPGELDGTMNKMHFEFTDDVLEVEKKIEDYIARNREAGETNSTDKLVRVLLSVPGLLRFGVSMYKWLDKHGLLSRKTIDASPFHCSFSISNLASIRTNHIFHHCYNFGTTSVFITMGNIVEVPKRGFAGAVTTERCLPLGVVMDERICSGSYFAAAFQRIKTYLADPRRMEGPPTFKLFSR